MLGYNKRKFIGESVSLLMMLTFIALFSVGTLRHLDGETKILLMKAEIVLLGLFTAEYAVRFWTAKNRRRYMFSFYGLIDGIAPLLLIAILILQAPAGIGALRLLTILRLLTVLKILPHCENSIRVFYRAFTIVRTDLAVFFVAFLILLYLSSAAVYLLEYNAAECAERTGAGFCSVFDGLWWAVITLTTVGYGDFIPSTPVGKVFTFIILLLGMAMIAIPAALLTSAFQEVRNMESSSPDEK